MSEEYYIRELRPFGIATPRTFRALCRAICCPVIIMGRVAFVDPAVFQVCMKHLSIPGSKDFTAPNSGIQTCRKRPYLRNKITPTEVKRNWKFVVRTILDARQVFLLAFGEHKASVVAKAVEQPASVQVSASALQQHPDARFVLDRAAAGGLTRFVSPWLVGPLDTLGLEWTEGLVRKAVIWLALQLQKSRASWCCSGWRAGLPPWRRPGQPRRSASSSRSRPGPASISSHAWSATS